MNYDENETTVHAHEPKNSTGEFQSLKIFYRRKERSIELEELPYLVGRDLDKCQLILRDSLASREHFRFELNEGLLNLIDSSKNGTWVQLGRAPTVHLNNNAIPLVGSGTIKAGSELRDDDPEKILFKVIYAASN